MNGVTYNYVVERYLLSQFIQVILPSVFKNVFFKEHNPWTLPEQYLKELRSWLIKMNELLLTYFKSCYYNFQDACHRVGLFRQWFIFIDIYWYYLSEKISWVFHKNHTFCANLKMKKLPNSRWSYLQLFSEKAEWS